MTEEIIAILKVLGAIVGLYVVQTLLKVADCYKSGTFDWKELGKGVAYNAMYFVAVIGLYAIAIYLIPNMDVITFGETNINLRAACDLIVYTLIALQASKVLNNLSTCWGLDLTFTKKEVSVEEVEEAEAEVVTITDSEAEAIAEPVEDGEGRG